jgi:hypothetical protein
VSDIFPIYEALWRRAQEEGVVVHYYEWPRDGTAGFFDAHSNNADADKTEIGVFRIGTADDEFMPSRTRGRGRISSTS